MYTILVDDNNRLVTTTKSRVMQRSKLVDDLSFLVKPMYNGHDMSRFTVSLEYVSPKTRKYRNEILKLAADQYSGYLKYNLPIDTQITNEAGEVELLMTFLLVDLDENGQPIQRVRKADGATITVCPVTAWSDLIPDEALSALDQRIIKTDAQIKALNDMGDLFNYTKADDLDYDKDSNELQLMAAGRPIGTRVAIECSGTPGDDPGSDDDDEQGFPVVDFDAINSGSADSTVALPDDGVVEFE